MMAGGVTFRRINTSTLNVSVDLRGFAGAQKAIESKNIDAVRAMVKIAKKAVMKAAPVGSTNRRASHKGPGYRPGALRKSTSGTSRASRSGGVPHGEIKVGGRKASHANLSITSIYVAFKPTDSAGFYLNAARMMGQSD